jgi:hypothetical protein
MSRKKGQQFAVQIYHFNTKDEINKHLDSGCKFIAQFEKNHHDKEHIIIFERTTDEKTKNDKKARGKDGSVPKR